MKPLIAVPIGDPAGIGPEIVSKALCDKDVYEKAVCQDYLALYGIFLGRDSERRDRGLSGCLCRWRICCFSQRCRIEMARFLQPESN